MLSATNSVRQAALAVIVAAAGFQVIPARADDGFPFGLEMTLDVAPQPGSKRLPTLEIGDNGEATLHLGCKAGEGPCLVCGQTRSLVCPPPPAHRPSRCRPFGRLLRRRPTLRPD